MGHVNKPSLIFQAKQALQSQLSIGRSKRDDKRRAGSDGLRGHIYTGETYRDYLKKCCVFVNWVRDNHPDCKTLADCRPYVAEWIVQGKDNQGWSASTQKTYLSAVAKMYRASTSDFDVKTDDRRRAKITRSRNDTVRDTRFKEYNHPDFVEFCRSVGLRNTKELSRICGNDLFERGDRLYVRVKGKGGKYRDAPVVGDTELVKRLCEAAGDDRVFQHIPTAADIHAYRGDYCRRVYDLYARPIDELRGVREWYGKRNPKTGEKILESAIYRMRRDRAGEEYDRAAMQQASRALGHERVSVIASNYLYHSD